MIEVAVENLRQTHEWAWQTGTVAQYMLEAKCKHCQTVRYSLKLVTNEVAELRDGTSEPSRSVAEWHVVRL